MSRETAVSNGMAVYRHELKFVCTEAELQLIENRIRHICNRDVHAGPSGVYHIRSMYFDTFDNEYYYQNEAGTDIRHKYRIRIYNCSDRVIRLERKSTVHGLKRKEVCNLTKEQCEVLLKGGRVMDFAPDQQILKAFSAEQAMKLLEPKIIVEYIRTPYVYPVGNVRITFDRNIGSSDSRNLFDRDIPVRRIMPGETHILEVKYDELLPGALLECVDVSHKLQRTSFSKYALCRKYSIR